MAALVSLASGRVDAEKLECSFSIYMVECHSTQVGCVDSPVALNTQIDPQEGIKRFDLQNVVFPRRQRLLKSRASTWSPMLAPYRTEDAMGPTCGRAAASPKSVSRQVSCSSVLAGALRTGEGTLQRSAPTCLRPESLY